MRKKLPDSALQYYIGLRAERSYQAVADHYGVSKRAVTKRATKDRWQERAFAFDEKLREQTERNLLESMEDMDNRHLRTLRAIQGKALESLKSTPIKSAMDAVRALDLAIKQERLIRGQPTDRTEISLEQTIRAEYERWMEPNGENEDAPNAAYL